MTDSEEEGQMRDREEEGQMTNREEEGQCNEGKVERKRGPSYCTDSFPPLPAWCNVSPYSADMLTSLLSLTTTVALL